MCVYFLRRFCCCLLLYSASAVVAATPPGASGSAEELFSWGEQTRGYRLLPAHGSPQALVVLLHGIGGDSHSFDAPGLLFWISVYRDHGYHFLIPSGLDSSPADLPGGAVHRAWNGGDPLHRSPEDCCFSLYTRYYNFSLRQSGSKLLTSPVAPDDSGGVNALIRGTAARLGVASNRIAVIGVSNGGILAYRLQCTLPSDSFAAVVSIQGALTGRADCGTGAARRFLHIHGDQDHIVPFAGGRTEIAPLYPDYSFRRGAKASLSAVAPPGRCFAGRDRGGHQPAVHQRGRDAPELPWSLVERDCPRAGSRYFLQTYQGAGHELRVSMFRTALAFSAAAMQWGTRSGVQPPHLPDALPWGEALTASLFPKTVEER